MKLIGVRRLDNDAKKYAALFDDNGRQFTVKFGQAGASDYTMHKDETRRTRYRQRHGHENITDPTKPATLSWFLTWGPYPSLARNIEFYRRKFAL